MPFADLEKRKEYLQQYRLKNKCIHKRIKYQCKDCGGNQICSHNRFKSSCKDCGGSQICSHNRRKAECKDCGGSQICSHNRIRYQCKDCGGSEFCIHNRKKSRCKECGGVSICIHNKEKSKCRDCEGSQICKHKIENRTCKECYPFLYFSTLQQRKIRQIMKENNILKTKPYIEYLGCSVEYFYDYIKSKMTEGMTFDIIEYDHIKPISSFDLNNEEEFINCCHYTNIQPLLKIDNRIKHCKWSEEDEIFWNENIKGKEYLPIYYPQKPKTIHHMFSRKNISY